MERNQAETPVQISSLWVFGYGSLCWNPGFAFHRKFTGHVKGFARRFWQGNATHRGTEDQPGRVATLIEDSESITWGCAYEVIGDAALSYLDNRECQLGGYLTKFATFYPHENGPDCTIPTFPTILYIATPKNRHWLGDAPLNDIADQITNSSGPSGHNVEYLLRLAGFMREKVPGVQDDHLFSLESIVKDIISARKLCLRTLLGETVDKHENVDVVNVSLDEVQERDPRPDTFQYTARVVEKKLRCLNM